MDPHDEDALDPAPQNVPRLSSRGRPRRKKTEAPRPPRLSSPSMKMPNTETPSIKSLEEENRRLKDELEALTRERDAVRDGMDGVLSDLLTTQFELEDEQRKSADKDSKITSLECEAERLGGVAKDLKSQLAEAERHSFTEGEALQRKSLQDAEEAAQRIKHLRSELAHSQADLAADRRLRETAEARLQELEQVQTTQGEQESQSEALDALRQQLAFYKANAERVSKWAREVEGANKQLKVALQDKDGHLHEQESEIADLRLQASGGFTFSAPPLPGALNNTKK